MVGANFLCPRRHHNALVNQLLAIANIKILINLTVVDEAQVTMLLHEALSNTINGIDWAPLEFVKVAGDHFCTSLDIWNKDGNLVFAGELAE